MCNWYDKENGCLKGSVPGKKGAGHLVRYFEHLGEEG